MKNDLKKGKTSYLYLLPALLIISLFVLYPIIDSILLSFTDKQGNITLETYEYVLSDEKFIKSLFNTVLYAVIATPLTLFLSLFVTYFLSIKIKFKNVFQTIYFLPYVTSTIAIGSVWAIMYHTDYGLFNSLLEAVGLDKVGWLTDPSVSMVSVIIFGVWKGLAFNILILFTAISGVDTSLEKAALIDGTSSIKTFFKIKLPQIYPILTYLIIIGLIHSLKVYEEVISLFGDAGPDSAASTLVYYIYDKFYLVSDPSAAAVAAVVLFVITIILTLFNRKITSMFRRGK